MNKKLKKLINKMEKEHGKDSPVVKAVRYFHRRLTAASIVSEDVFGEKVSPEKLLLMYDYLLKEEAAAIYLNGVAEATQALKGCQHQKSSVIAPAPPLPPYQGKSN